MADGNIDIELELDDSKAVSNGRKAGSDIAKGIESGLKNVGKAADSAEKSIEKPLQNASKKAKSSFSDVGSAARSSFSDVGDAAKSAADDASSAFDSVPSDAKGAFADVSSEAKSGFDGVSDAASNASSDASSAFQSIPADAGGSFSDVSSEAQSGFSGVADAAQSASSDAASAFQNIGASVDGAFDEVGDSARQAGREVSEAFGTNAVMAGNIAADAIEAAASKAIEFGKSAIDSGTEFDKSMSQVAATMGMTTDEIGDLTEFAKEMGASTAFSASQASEALNYMALAGYDAETSMKMLPTVLNLAAAGDMELATASDMVTDAQSALGLSLDETAEMVDKMAKASSKSNTSVEQLGSAFLTVGGTAKNLKGGTTELATALGILADNGIKGSEGGTALRNIILSLSAPTDKAAEAISNLGVSVFDSAGDLRSLDDIFNDLNGSLSKMTQGEQTQALNQIFNKVDLKSVNALLANTTNNIGDVAEALRNTSVDVDRFGFEAEASGDSVVELGKAVSKAFSESNGDIEAAVAMLQDEFIISYDEARELVEATSGVVGESSSRFQELTGHIDAAAGSAQKMADTQLDNLAGDMTLLESATEGLYISISDKLSPILRNATQFATNTVIPALMDIVKNFGDIAPKIVAVVAAFAVMKAKSVVLKALASDTGLAAKAAQNLGRDFATMTTKQKVAAIATNGLRGALNGLKAAMPLIAITALFEGITLVVGEMKKAEERTQKLDSSTRGLESAASGLTVKIDDETGAIESLDDAASSVSLEDLTQQHIDLANAISETNQSAYSSQSMLSQYQDTISELAGKTLESEEDIARLKIAVDGVNDAMGTSYTVVQDASDAYQIMADGEAVATDKLYELIEAQKAQIRAQAEAENYKAVYDQMAKDEEAVAQASKKAADAQEALRKKTEELGDARYTTIQSSGEMIDKAQDEVNAYDRAKQALSDVEAQASATQSSLNKLEEQQILTAMASKKGADALIKAADANTAFKAGVQGIDVDLVAFTEALQDMGFTSEQVASMSAEDAMKLASAWTGGYDEMLSATDEVFHEIPQSLQNMGADAYNEAYGAGSKTGQGFSSGLSSEAQASIDAALGIVGMTRDEFDKLAEEAGIEGDEAAVAFANSIASGESESKKSGQINNTAALEGFGSKDSTPQGNQLRQKFALAVGSNTDQSRQGGESQAEAAEQGMKSKDDEAGSWGDHLVQNFANGIRAAVDFVTGAANFIANAVSNILGHTVPKEGILREGGRGEAVWGEHLVQNIADGMLSSRARRAIKDASREVAVDINDTLIAEMERIDPMAQLEESLAKGSAAFNMSATMVGAAPSYTTNNQTNNFNGPVNSPDIIAREMRLQQHYGLAGNY